MTFAHPQILWLLLVFPPALVAFFWWSWRKRQALMAQFIQARLLPGLVAGLSPQRQKLREASLVLAVVCLILALARPQWGFSWQEVKQRGVDIVVAIDVSKSMLATDITPSRLARAKLAALDLMQQAKSDRLGLVAFAGSAFLPCPLTIDDTAFRQSVEALDVNSISQGGTALAEAIETALTAFKEGDNHKILVLMTDGEDQDSGAVEAAKKAAAAGLRIYTIGIGTAEGELLRIKNPDGSSDYVRDEQGNVVKSHLNEQLLQEIASTTEGGFYLPLRGAKTIDTLYSEGLSKLPKSEHQQKLVKQYYERFHWPLAIAIGLLLVEMLLPERKREMNNIGNSRERAQKAQRAAPIAAVLCLLCLFAANAAVASPSSALRDYKAGKYDQAQKEYEELLQKKNEDPRLHFNAGAAAYRNKQFDEATKQFNEALASPDLKLQALAYYNRGNSQFYLGEQNPDPNKRVETWEKALKDYDLSLKLNAQDPDAKFNQEFVKKRLEELKQQQQQQQQNNQNKSDQQKQDQNQQQQNQQNDQQKQDQNQQQQSQQQQQQSGQKQDSAQQNQQSQQKQQDKQQQQQQADKQSQEQKKQQAQQQEQQQAQQNSGQDKDKAEEQESAQAYPAGQMTPDQARQLMDAQKGEEKMLMLKPEDKPVNANRRLRDW